MKVIVSSYIQNRSLEPGDIVCLDNVGYYLVREEEPEGRSKSETRYSLVGLSGSKSDYASFDSMDKLIKNIYKNHKVRVFNQDDYGLVIGKKINSNSNLNPSLGTFTELPTYGGSFA